MKNQSVGWALKAGAMFAALLTASCAENAISDLEAAKREGTPFAHHLAREYEAFAKKDSRDYNHELDARHFAVKGIQASQGLHVLPEDPRQWSLPDSSVPAITEARERLTFALEKGGRNVAPELAAKTQVLYDCWVQETENDDRETMDSCRKGYSESIVALESAVNKAAPTFAVFFESNSSKMGVKEKKMLEEIAKVAINLPTYTVTITGNTDALGGRKHNLILSQNRAAAVRDGLIALGVPANRIVSVGCGELGTKEVEPKNRRVDVQIR